MDKDILKGIITKGVGGLYTVRPLCDTYTFDEEYLCRAKGAFRYEGITPVPGDFAEVELTGEEDERSGAAGVICRILPRRNFMIRPPMANLTHMLVTVPAASPRPDLLYVDKLTSIADAFGIDCTIIVNKRDLAPDYAAEIAGEYAGAGFRVFITDAVSGEGCAELAEWIGGISVPEVQDDNRVGDPDDLCCGAAIAAFAGASGAGKSSLTGRLFPGLSPEVGRVSRKTERGRHTTRAVEIYPIRRESSGGDDKNGLFFIADTPGFSMLDFKRFDFYDPERLSSAFREFSPYIGNCRYSDCTHTKEEDCAVREAAMRGEISRRRHESYVKLYLDMKEKPDWQRRQEKEDL